MTKSHLMVGVAGGLFLLATTLVIWPKSTTPPDQATTTNATVSVGQTSFNVTVADTSAKQVKGLGGTDHLDSHQGMYFPQEAGNNPTFWMKDMLIPIDIIWIKHGRVIGINANAQPPLPAQQQADWTLYNSPEDFPEAILEIGANRAAEYGIKIGDAVVVQP